MSIEDQGGIKVEIEYLKKNYPEHWQRATALRILSIDAVQKANSGHPGMPMGMADVVSVLFEKHLKFDASKPNWFDRDRFILSAGHGSMLLYSILHLTGYQDIKLEDLKNFRQIHSPTAGHPEYGYAAGIETTTGPLGQGLANAVGFALSEASLSAKWGKKIVNHKTFVLVGDGCLMEGISQEAIAFAGRQKLNKLIVLWDDNRITIDGEISKSCVTDQTARFLASNWSVFLCDGHDPNSIDIALKNAQTSPLPSLIKCQTHIGFGSPNKQDTASAHGAPLGKDEIEKVREIYSWKYEPFVLPSEAKDLWLDIGLRGRQERIDWEQRLEQLSSGKKKNFERIINCETPKTFTSQIRKLKRKISIERPAIATRKSSELVLSLINDTVSETLGGSADLTGSNNTLTAGMGTFSSENRSGRYIYYGIREHGMAAIMNGIALHGGTLPYGGTFLAFSDYARGAMRLSALMKLRVIYVMTHDSIGLGEDGPTHQPVEHLAMLRATPNMNVFRPADTIETAECWEIAIQSKDTPSVLALSRQSLPTLRTEYNKRNLAAYGGYILKDSKSKRRVIILSSGSEVKIALEAQQELEGRGIGVRVVSIPCWELFEQQPEKYRRKVLPSGPIRVAVEAGVRFGWDKWLTNERGRSNKSIFVGMSSFGASGPAEDLYENFGITSKNVVKQIEKYL